MTNSNINQQKTALWIFLGGWVVLAALFGVFDLEISQAMFNPNAGWASFLHGYGQIPGMVVNLLSSNLLFNLRSRQSGVRSNLSAVALFLYSIVTSSEFWGDVLGIQFDRDVSLWTMGLLGLATVVVVQVIFHRMSEKSLQRFERAAIISVLLSILASIISVWLIKYSWGRVRFLDLAADFSDFTPWFLPQGPNGNHSFVSGHTAFAWLVLPVTLLFKRGDTSWRVVWGMAIIWGLLGAISRVVHGAHYPSDVLFSTGITIGWFFLLKRWVPKAEAKTKQDYTD